jgi:uncharacterized membrane protein YczE
MLSSLRNHSRRAILGVILVLVGAGFLVWFIAKALNNPTEIWGPLVILTVGLLMAGIGIILLRR